MSDLTGQRLGEYQILRKIGSGGMADVYAARQMKLQRDVALKVLRPGKSGGDDLQRDLDNLKRFQREAQAAARLNHPSIVQVYEFGEVGDVHFISQELVDGINLKQLLDRDGPLGADAAINVLRSVAGALQVAHDAGVTHRDVKPENIMQGDDFGIKVTDFGLARMLTAVDSSTANLTRAGLTLGTPRYMSPEQIQGHPVDARSDLYSLGVTMYHLLAGTPPFADEEPLALAVKHINETPLPLDRVRGTSDLPGWLVSLVMRCLQKSPASRFASASELLAVVDQHAAQPDAGKQDANGSNVLDETHDSISTKASAGQRTLASPFASSHAFGAGSATVRLQRVVDRSQQERKSRTRRRILIGILSVVGLGIGGLTATATRPSSIRSQLRGPIVSRTDSIAQQYLIAITRNDVPGWLAVMDYFPVDQAAENAPARLDYHHKATLQLSRLYIEQGHYDQALALLDQLQKSATLKRLYGLVATVHRHEIAVATDRPQEASRLKSQIAREVQSLAADNPSALESFRGIVPSAERLALGLVD
ncbi:serine/threonine protein kinase [Neorhodopirellula lusitana]|uniref:Serine/threonine protein kinase n=1 Tax=Neorhodopirellula lusitana TaxID=445327 RepID=A0ABY1QA16_9BACT|nr:protein kinase [Neorhodopirellula lusitana]SMP62161.1 serine/threonine protein kinase [Neorhodopirellula lusitana]